MMSDDLIKISSPSSSFYSSLKTNIGDKRLDPAEHTEEAGENLDNYFDSNDCPNEPEIDYIGLDHPLLNNLILHLIFDILDTPTLKTCRQVCSKWLLPGTKRLLQRVVVCLDAEDVSKLEKISLWMTNTCKSYFTNFSCDKITHQSYPNIWPLLGPHVRTFIVSHWWGNSKDLTLQDYEDLLLRRCPSLEELVMPSTVNFKRAQNFLNCASLIDEEDEDDVSATTRGSKNYFVGSNQNNSKHKFHLNLKALKVTGIQRPHMGFWRIVTLSPNLANLSIECQLAEEFWNPYPPRKIWERRMSSLSNLEVRSYANESVSLHSATFFMGRRWSNLKKLTFECYDLPDHTIRECMDHIKDSVEDLSVVLFNKIYDPSPSSSSDKDKGKEWMISPLMTKLKKFKLQTDDHSKGPIFCRAVVLAMLLRNLESITLTMYEDGENVTEWGEGLFNLVYNHNITMVTFQNSVDVDLEEEENEENCHKFKGQVALKILVLPPKMRDTSCVLPLLKIFPNVTSLTLEIPSVKFLQLIFMYWRKLERLSLTLEIDLDQPWGVNWNFVLVGLEIVRTAAGGSGGDQQEVFSYSNGASIANLQQLKSLDIKMVVKDSLHNENYAATGRDPTHWYLTDLVVYSGLFYLTQIQHIRVEGQSFSIDAVTALREKLGPFCHLDFGSE